MDPVVLIRGSVFPSPRGLDIERALTPDDLQDPRLSRRALLVYMTPPPGGLYRWVVAILAPIWQPLLESEGVFHVLAYHNIQCHVSELPWRIQITRCECTDPVFPTPITSDMQVRPLQQRVAVDLGLVMCFQDGDVYRRCIVLECADHESVYVMVLDPANPLERLRTDRVLLTRLSGAGLVYA